jgi:hypothetical protein
MVCLRRDERPGRPSKTSQQKEEKRAHDSEPHVDGWTAACEKATREYLMWSTTHTIIDDALKAELRMARRSFTLLPAE